MYRMVWLLICEMYDNVSYVGGRGNTHVYIYEIKEILSVVEVMVCFKAWEWYHCRFECMGEF